MRLVKSQVISSNCYSFREINVYLSRMIKFSQSPIDQSEFAIFVVNHDVMGFDISVHDTHTMAVI